MPMTTLQIGDDWPDERLGGLSRYFTELIRYLPGTGTAVRGLVVGSETIAEKTNGVVSPFAGSQDPLWKRVIAVRLAAARQIQDGRVDLIASHFALYTAPLRSQMAKLPLVVHFHGPWAAESNTEGAALYSSRLKLLVERSVYRRAARLIVLSRSFQKELVQSYGIDEQRTRIVPGGIDTERFHCRLSKFEARGRLGWPADRPIIVTVRRLVRRMGLETLIEAMKEAALACPDVLLLIGGKGPLSDELRKQIAESGLVNNVRLLGLVEEQDLPLAYRAADFSVIPSQALEGFGLTMLESMASGTPVLVTPVGGLPEVIEPFAPQCVFGNTGVREIAGVLTEVLKGQRPLPQEEACRAYAVNHFGWPLIAEKVRTIYDEALG